MPTEYEYPFLSFDKTKVINEIKKQNGIHVGTFLFRVQVLKHPLNKDLTYVRVRDEGTKITMTYKYKTTESEKFPTEYEVIINDFNEMVKILLGLGCKKSHYYEKIREIWELDVAEIVFDNYPMLPELMEIETKTEKDLNDMIKIFNLKIEDKNVIKSMTVLNLYGFDYIKDLDTTFENIKQYESMVKESKSQFDVLTKHQLKIYNDL